MKYYLDTEFITGFKKDISFLPTIGNWNKNQFYIQLVSIGIVAEDGREYYAISNEFNPNLADDWVKENVLSKLPNRRVGFHDSPRGKQETLYYKSNKIIANEIINFIDARYVDINDKSKGFMYPSEKIPNAISSKNVSFYAYYADYDWVVFCSLFGKMIDLPNGFPMYCRDLKQVFDEKQEYWASLTEDQRTSNIYRISKKIRSEGKKPIYSTEVNLKHLSFYPVQENEHNALDDAKWNKELDEFLRLI